VLLNRGLAILWHLAACWRDTIPGRHLTSRKYSQREEETKEQMINIMVNKVQHNAILVMTYQNTRGFLRTLGRGSRKYIHTWHSCSTTYLTTHTVLFFSHDRCQLKAQENGSTNTVLIKGGGGVRLIALHISLNRTYQYLRLYPEMKALSRTNKTLI
jgi:phosphoribosyl-AMP cyclohydrolase